jgi:hypothetical protein
MTDNITKEKQLRGRIKAAIIITMIGLLFNGMSSVPLRSELDILLSHPNRLPQFLLDWWTYVRQGVYETSEKYEFMRYGFDWLAFAHLMIAIAFIGPLRDPVKNQWVVKWGMIVAACGIVMAFGWERMRGIPVWWSFIDAGISYAAFVVLWLCNRWIGRLKFISGQ